MGFRTRANAVTEKTWRAFWLSSVEGHVIKHVVGQVGMSVGSVYIARSRVMKRLQTLVKKYEEISDAEDM